MDDPPRSPISKRSSLLNSLRRFRSLHTTTEIEEQENRRFITPLKPSRSLPNLLGRDKSNKITFFTNKFFSSSGTTLSSDDAVDEEESPRTPRFSPKFFSKKSDEQRKSPYKKLRLKSLLGLWERQQDLESKESSDTTRASAVQERSQEIDLEEACQNELFREELTMKLISFHCPDYVKVRFIGYCNDFVETKDKSERKRKARKIISVFLKRGSKFEISPIPVQLRRDLFNCNFEALEQIKKLFIRDLSMNSIVMSMLQEFRELSSSSENHRADHFSAPEMLPLFVL